MSTAVEVDETLKKILPMKKSVCRVTPLNLSEELKKTFNEKVLPTPKTILPAMNECSTFPKVQKDKELREKVINEIFSSEITYLKQLEIIMKFFMEPIKNKSWLPQTTFHALFGNIEIIYKVNGELLHELKTQNGNVGAAFNQLAPYLKLYSVYAYDYKQALQILQTMVKKNKELSDFISKNEKRPEVSNSLHSLLIAPIQRIPRYKLLLQEVLNYTSSCHPEYIIIKNALEKIEETALHINNLVSQYENSEMMLALAQRLICPVDIIQPARKIVKQGPVMKVSKSGRASSSRFLVLFTDSLMYCKGGEEGPLRFSGFFPIKHCQVEPILSTCIFKITCQDEMLLLYSLDPKIGQEWIAALQEATKQQKECRKTLRKESSKRKPFRRKGILESRPISSPKTMKSKPGGCFGRLRFLRRHH